MVGTEEDRMSSGRDFDLGRPDGPAGATNRVFYSFATSLVFYHFIWIL